MRKLEENEWWPDLVAKKDEFSLRELAEMFGATPGAINTALKRNGIERTPAPPGPRSRRGRPPAPKRSGDVPRARGARSSTRVKLEPFESQIGVLSDANIAELAGVSVQTVARYRNALGIAPSRKRKRMTREEIVNTAEAPVAPRGSRSKVEPFVHLLGEVSDAEVAELAGVTANAVRNYRARRSLPSPSAVARQRREAPSPIGAVEVVAPEISTGLPAEAGANGEFEEIAPPARETSPPPRGVLRMAYKVQIDERVVIVVSTDIVDAANQARAAGGDVKMIELVGEILT